jgi:hypothetical protein
MFGVSQCSGCKGDSGIVHVQTQEPYSIDKTLVEQNGNNK